VIKWDQFREKKEKIHRREEGPGCRRGWGVDEVVLDMSSRLKLSDTTVFELAENSEADQ
jgi:hypothetical protein